MMTGGGAGAAHMKVVHLFDEALVPVEAYLLAGLLLPVIKALSNAALLNGLLLLEVLHPVVDVLVLVVHLHAAQMRNRGNAHMPVSFRRKIVEVLCDDAFE